MSPFLICMIAGLFGLLLVALPGLLHGHGHAGHELGHAGHAHEIAAHAGHVHGGAHVVHGTHGGAAHGHAHGPTHTAGVENTGPGFDSLLRLLQPRVLFSLLALYGAFGFGLAETGLLSTKIAALVAVLPALLLEKFALTPMWNALLKFEGEPCSPLEALVLTEAVAVSKFYGGKGIVQVQRDGRAIQMSARLIEAQADAPIRVGDRLHVEDVDAARERVTVSLKG